jgi:hypothetical protein
MKLALLRYAMSTYIKGETPTIYRGLVQLCERTKYNVLYLDIESGAELYVHESTGWEDHWEEFKKVFDMQGVDPDSLQIMQFPATVEVCTQEQKLKFKRSQGMYEASYQPVQAKMSMLEPIDMSWVLDAHNVLLRMEPNFEWYMTVARQCNNGAFTIVVENLGGKKAILHDITGPDDAFAEASVIWPEVTDWRGLKGTQVVIPENKYCLKR